MKAYAVAQIRTVNFGPGIVEYLKNIDETLQPFGGRYIIHGGSKDVLEGHWPGDLVMIEFPSREMAEGWYNSAAYQRILDFRMANSDGDVAIVDGVSAGHRAVDILAAA